MSKNDESEYDFQTTETQTSEECNQNFDKIVQLGAISQIQKNPQNQKIFYLGIEFNKEFLLERNKNPILILHLILISLILFFGTFFVIFLVGTNFYVIYCIFFPYIFITFSYSIIIQLQMSPQKITVQKPLKIIFMIGRLMTITTCILSFILKTPFNSLWILLIGLQLIFTNVSFQATIATEKNQTPENEQNYQFNYIFNKIFLAVLNGSGFADVFSDIVWGIEIILKFHEFQKIFGGIILFLCFVDSLCLYYRIYQSGKVTLKFHILTIIIELIILIISIVTMTIQILTGLNYQDRDFLGLAILSIFTTVVNLLHHVAIMMDFLVQQKQCQIKPLY